MEGATDIQHYVPGDMIWAKIAKNSPYWPCMVGYDPIKGNYFRVCKKRTKEYVIYHVQYFGDKVSRGWTNRNILPYEGIEKFYDKFCVSSKSKENAPVKKGSELLINGNRIKTHIAQSWNNAVKEAEEAFIIKDITERFTTYVFNYEIVKKKCVKANLKSRQNLSSENGIENDSISENQEVQKSKKMKLSSELENDKGICFLCTKLYTNVSCLKCPKEFHLDCLGLVTANAFVCAECESGIRACFECDKSGINVIKCGHPKCYKYYHPDCLKKLPCSNGKICSLHTCLTCYTEDSRNLAAKKGNLITCFRCPSAFHARESCIPAGCVELITNVSLVCPFHFVLKRNNSKRPQVINVNECIRCDEGGDLILCDACPNAYHEKCLEDNDVPDGLFLCEYCEKKNHYYYSMIVWCKIGNHSWWPAKIINPSDLPDNIKKITHHDGEFPVKFFGTHDFCWTSRGRVIAYEEDHKNYKHLTTGKNKKEYKEALLEAKEEFDDWKAYRQSVSLCNDFPPSYKSIKVNRLSKDLPPTTTKEIDNVQCNCKASDTNPCGTNECMNRSTLMECCPRNCMAGEKCENKRFQRRQYKKTKLVKTDSRGWGLAATEDIRKGDFILEYVGEIITPEECRKRAQAQKTKDIYYLYLDCRRVIDAGPMGNYSRFINHSCDPNCVMEKWAVCGDSRVGIFAIKDIFPGEELTFDYQLEIFDILQECFCQSSNCRGIIGKKNDFNVRAKSYPKKSSSKKFCKKSNECIVSDSQSSSSETSPSRPDTSLLASTSTSEYNGDLSSPSSSDPLNHVAEISYSSVVPKCNRSSKSSITPINCNPDVEQPNSSVSLFSDQVSSVFSEEAATSLTSFGNKRRLPARQKSQSRKLTSKSEEKSYLPEISSSSFLTTDDLTSYSSSPSSSISSESPLSRSLNCNPVLSLSRSSLSMNSSFSIVPGSSTFNTLFTTDMDDSFLVTVQFDGNEPLKISKADVLKLLFNDLGNATVKINRLSVPHNSILPLVPISKKSQNSDNLCFICKKCDNLMSCDKEKCNRAYHLLCLGFSSVPNGYWECPRHRCKICEKESSFLCESCPTSFCIRCFQKRIVPNEFFCQVCELKKKKLKRDSIRKQ